MSKTDQRSPPVTEANPLSKDRIDEKIIISEKVKAKSRWEHSSLNLALFFRDPSFFGFESQTDLALSK